jgi:hypothetical protein
MTCRNQATFMVAAAAFLVLGACGGGSGGSAPAPAVVPPPAPPPPSARVVAPASVPQEGQPFSLDASTSTAASGSALTFAWTQTAGPAIAITNPSAAKIDLIAPEVTADTPVTLQVVVREGTQSATATATVTISNIAQTPVFDGLRGLVASAVFPDRPLGGTGRFGDPLVFTEKTPGGPIAISSVKATQSGTTLNVTALERVTGITQPARFGSVGLTSAFAFGGPIVLEESANQVRLFRELSETAPFEALKTIAVTAPCASDQGSMSNANDVLFIGQRGNGFSAVDFTLPGGQTRLAERVDNLQSLCGLIVANRPINGSVFRTSRFDFIPDILAYNTGTNTLELYSDANRTGVDAATYGLAATASVSLNATERLKLVKARRNFKTLALLFTDEKHAGTHRLVIAGLDVDRGIVQRTFSWPIGVPVDMFNDNLDGDGFPEVVIMSSTSPQAIVFEANGPPSAELASFSGPAFMEIGLGATSGESGNYFGSDSMMVFYADKKEARLYGAKR